MTTKLIPTLRSLLLLTIAFTFALIANYAYGQWTPPTAPPPGNNVAAPLNVSSIDQTKGGAGGGMITAPVFRAADRMRSDLYCDYAGNNCFAPVDVGSGGPSGTGGNCTLSTSRRTACLYGSGDMSNSVSCPAGTVPMGPAYRTSSCSTNNYTYARDCLAISCTSGPSGGGTTLPTCSNGEVVKYSNGNWVCAADDQGSGGTSIALPLSCPSGQVLRGIAANGSAQCTSQVSSCTSGGVNYTTGSRCTVSVTGCTARVTGSCPGGFCNVPGYRENIQTCQSDGSWSNPTLVTCIAGSPPSPSYFNMCGS